MNILVLFLIMNHQCMIMNRLKLSIGIHTWIRVLKIRLPGRIFVSVREKGKEITEKNTYIIFTLQQILLECLKWRVFLTCSAKGPERLLWADSRAERVNSTVGGAHNLLIYI